MEQGVRVNAYRPNNHLDCPLYYALISTHDNRDEFIEYLLVYGADPCVLFKGGKSLFHVIVGMTDYVVVGLGKSATSFSRERFDSKAN